MYAGFGDVIRWESSKLSIYRLNGFDLCTCDLWPDAIIMFIFFLLKPEWHEEVFKFLTKNTPKLERDNNLNTPEYLFSFDWRGASIIQGSYLLDMYRSRCGARYFRLEAHLWMRLTFLPDSVFPCSSKIDTRAFCEMGFLLQRHASLWYTVHADFSTDINLTHGIYKNLPIFIAIRFPPVCITGNCVGLLSWSALYGKAQKSNSAFMSFWCECARLKKKVTWNLARHLMARSDWIEGTDSV